MTESQGNAAEGQAYPPGTFIWNDVTTPDAASARAFYTSLFGWDVDGTPGDEYGGYGMFFQTGKRVAGIGSTMNDTQPAAWSPYVMTENAAETTAKVTAAGGQVLLPPVAIGPNGTMALFLDPTGASFGVWQPGVHKGADLFHSPVSVAWNELQSGDIASASAFYAEVFGWEGETSGFRDSEYTMWRLNGQGVAGGMPLGVTMPTETAPFWLVFISVRNCDDTVALACELGATVLAAATTSEDGRYAVLQDPQGAIFGVISAVTQ